MISEDQLEQLCISWFKETGYQTVTGKQISPEGKTPERENYGQVILYERLVSQLKRINPSIPSILIEDAAKRIAIPETPVLTKNNHIFHKCIIEGLSVEFNEKEENKTEYIKLIDFDIIENNQFLVVNQFTVSGTKHFRRPDLIVFINGLPIAVIELKNPVDENADIWDAYNQLQTYKEEISDLFVFVVQEKKYSDRLLETLRKYNNRAIETAQVIEELIQMAKDMAKDDEMAEKSGLNSDEIAFYRALIQNESAVRELGDNNLRELAKEVTQKLKKSTTVDWQVRDSVRAKLRILIRRALKRWKYPPDGAKEAVELVLKQVEVLSNTWSR